MPLLGDNVQIFCTAGMATDDNVTPSIRFVNWINKTTNIYSEYVIFVAFFTVTMFTRTRHDVAFKHIFHFLLNLISIMPFRPFSS